MLAFLRTAFTDWFSGKARDFRPIDHRSAEELRTRFLSEYRDYKKPSSLTPESEVLDMFLQKVLPQSSGMSDPRYLSHMASNVPIIALTASWLMTILNQNVIEQSEASATVTFVEEQVINWMSSLIGFDPSVAGGSAVVDGTIANLTMLLVARNKAFPELMKHGFVSSGGDLPQAVVFVSQRAHYSIQKAAGILGLGRENVISVPVDNNDRMNVNELRRMVAEAETGGKKVIAVVGVAGTSETGAIDPLDEIADLASEKNIWFHVDAAYGGAALTSTRYKDRFEGIKRADSVTVDGHKWFYIPFELGMIVFADRNDMNWIKETVPYTIKDPTDLGKTTIEGSRAANALKLWMTMRALGSEGYGYIIDHCIETAQYLNHQVGQSPSLEILAQGDLNFASFRYVPAAVKERLRSARDEDEIRAINAELNEFNRLLQIEFKKSGKGFFAVTSLSVPAYSDPITSMRSIIMNPFTTREIIDDVLAEFVGFADALWKDRAFSGTR